MVSPYSSEMELSPDKPGAVSDDDSLLCIAGRIAEGLHPCMVYPDTDYLSTVKAELRKLLKQGSVCMFTTWCSVHIVLVKCVSTTSYVCSHVHDVHVGVKRALHVVYALSV